MNDIQPFTPITQTAPLTVGTTAASTTLPTVLPSGQLSGNVQVLVTNLGANPVYLAWGPGNPAAVVPTPGTLANVLPIIGQSQQTLTLPDGVTISAIAANTGNTVLFTVGRGF